MKSFPEYYDDHSRLHWLIPLVFARRGELASWDPLVVGTLQAIFYESHITAFY